MNKRCKSSSNFYIHVISAFIFCAAITLSTTAWAVEKLSVSDALSLSQTGNILLIDIRSPEEWSETGIPVNAFANSMHVKGFLERLEEKIDGNLNRSIALICATGVRSAWLALELNKRGYLNIYDVSGGVISPKDGWLAMSLPIKTY